jgi:alkanesulfonate monooxygenase SsuD/methylene tetrahydromethanopterin reductase-like flavin-dependent oxidoreductase (luciferase family)
LKAEEKMRIEFTVDISSLETLEATSRGGRIDRSLLVDLAWAAESASIDRLLITEGNGAQDATSIASYFLHATATLGVEVEHRADLISPDVAARQIATLDQLSGGRITVRVASPSAEGLLSHEESFAQLDEYLMLLKRLWANHKPIDYEGRFHRLRAAFSGAKPFAAAAVPIALAGVSGTAVNVTARHADVFVLPAASVEETRRTITRVRDAVARYRRADAVRFALPVRPSKGHHLTPVIQYTDFRPSASAANLRASVGGQGNADHVSHRAVDATAMAGSPEKLALALIDVFGSSVAPLVRRALAHRSGNHPGEELRAGFANPSFARWGRYPA